MVLAKRAPSRGERVGGDGGNAERANWRRVGMGLMGFGS